MRIIGGKHRGRVFTPPSGLPVRPTTDQAKEGLFNILSHRFNLNGITTLELFAGTGNVSYELWSRGAIRLTVVDEHAACCRFMRQTMDILGANCEVVCSKSERFLNQQPSVGPFDFVFMDPPYAYTGVPELLNRLFTGNFLQPEACVVVEHASSTRLEGLPHFLESRKYGNSTFSFFQQ